MRTSDPRNYILNPKVVIMVGRKAAIDAAAQLTAKYITPAAYTWCYLSATGLTGEHRHEYAPSNL